MNITHTLRGWISALLIFLVAIGAVGNEDSPSILPEFIGMWSGGAAGAGTDDGWTVEFVITGGASTPVGLLAMEIDPSASSRHNCLHNLALDISKMKDGTQTPEAAMDRNVLYMNTTSYTGTRLCRFGNFKVELFNDSEMRAELEWLNADGEVEGVWKSFMERFDDGTTGKILETCKAEDSESLGPRIGMAPAEEKGKKKKNRKKNKKEKKEANKTG